MSTHINDLSSSVLVRAVLPPRVLDSEDPVGSAADFGEGDGPCFAVQIVGQAESEASLTGHIEESDDQATWNAISGAEFDTTAETGLQIIRFTRSRRYLRWAGTFSPNEGDSLTVAAIVQQCKKTT